MYVELKVGNNKASEIIETYWNVNFSVRYICIPERKRNNRNILECKYIYSITNIFNYSEIIETYWNVNVGM